MLDILDLIREFFAGLGITAIAELPDFFLGALIVIVLIIAFRLIVDLVSALVRTALSVGVLLLILWVLISVFT